VTASRPLDASHRTPLTPPAGETAPPSMLTVRQALVQASLAPIDAQVLLAHVLGVDRAWLAAHATDAIA
jgi:hypothetical protein